MTGQVLILDDILQPDRLAFLIANQYTEWELLRNQKVQEWLQIQEYIFATDTTQTTNAKLPWSNKTVIPKLCQIRDNLFANYMSSLFPKAKWLDWVGESRDNETADKKKAIESYIDWAIDRNEFYDEVAKLVLDYIDYGNAFATVEWHSGSYDLDNPEQIADPNSPTQKVGYVGPMIRRVSPFNIVFNPLADSFSSSPKIIQSIMSIGEAKEMMLREAITPDEKKDAETLFEYMLSCRKWVRTNSVSTNIEVKNKLFDIAGFTNFAAYLDSDCVEVLTFYGDTYDRETGEFKKNQVVKIVDRHKIISQRDNPSFFGTAPIWHVGWRIRPDNLWAMGPLDNLIGIQYRIDHIENMKADVWDLTAYPPLKIKGFVDEFKWAPFERINIGDDGDVELMSPAFQVLSANTEIENLQNQMEVMAGSPREAVGIRSPGEKTAYEVQQLQNAASRVFQNKINQFERQIVENGLNGMLELARRNITVQTIRVFDDQLKAASFLTLTPSDITGMGRIRPFAARHFAEVAQMVQSVTQFFGSPAGQDPNVLMHFSSVQLAQMWEHLLNLEDYNIVQPFVRLAEQTEAQQLMHIHQETSNNILSTSGGLSPGDHDPTMGQQP